MSFSAPMEAFEFTETLNLIMQAYKQVGYRVKIVPMPAKRAMHEAVHSDWVDGVLGRVELAGKALSNYTRISVPIGKLEIFAYYRQDSSAKLADIGSWSALSPHKVATLRGFLIASHNLTKHKVDFQQVTYARQAFEMLIRHHVDLVVLPRQMAEHVLKSGEFGEVRQSPTYLEQELLYHYLHQKHDALVPVLTLHFSRLFPQYAPSVSR
ncbi:hypothetical protein [Thalassomonas sp. RHCl1]|uniref:hypothetical protein n=1 Tax=Thalassomonas sp. RHCl1 TaxID=2995320 RepID=UPI00248C850A|nr:hypothetical protein [Thalassomonas sp. RHCl1]